jgi:hypothetical protein
MEAANIATRKPAGRISGEAKGRTRCFGGGPRERAHLDSTGMLTPGLGERVALDIRGRAESNQPK